MCWVKTSPPTPGGGYWKLKFETRFPDNCIAGKLTTGGGGGCMGGFAGGTGGVPGPVIPEGGGVGLVPPAVVLAGALDFATSDKSPGQRA